MKKMKKENVIIEVQDKDVEKAKKLGYEIYIGYLLPNAEVVFDEWLFN